MRGDRERELNKTVTEEVLTKTALAMGPVRILAMTGTKLLLTKMTQQCLCNLLNHRKAILGSELTLFVQGS